VALSKVDYCSIISIHGYRVNSLSIRVKGNAVPHNPLSLRERVRVRGYK
jgi:hypothetical protein